MAGLSKAAGHVALASGTMLDPIISGAQTGSNAIGEQGRDLHRGERREATTHKTPNAQPIHVGRHSALVGNPRIRAARIFLTVQRPLAATPVPAAVDVSASETTLKSRPCQVLAMTHRPPEPTHAVARFVRVIAEQHVSVTAGQLLRELSVFSHARSCFQISP